MNKWAEPPVRPIIPFPVLNLLQPLATFPLLRRNIIYVTSRYYRILLKSWNLHSSSHPVFVCFFTPEKTTGAGAGRTDPGIRRRCSGGRNRLAPPPSLAANVNDPIGNHVVLDHRRAARLLCRAVTFRLHAEVIRPLCLPVHVSVTTERSDFYLRRFLHPTLG